MSKLLITGGRVLTQERELDGGAVSVENGIITGVYETPRPAQPGETVVDARGLYVSPGFIDIHVHGGGGFDFMSGEKEQVIGCCRTHLRHGTTTIVPTLCTAAYDSFVRAMSAIDAAAAAMEHGPYIPGIHLEGPYFAPSQAGAQSPEFLRRPDPDEYLAIVERFPSVMRWAAAPELPGALEMGRALTALGVRMSMGHSDATFDEALRAYECGYTCVTHLYSACSSVRRINAYRHAGIVEAAFLLDGMTVEIIADGKHLPESLLRLIYKIKGPDRICLITDGISAAGLENVSGEIYDQSIHSKIIIEDQVAKMPDRSCFAGSVATTDRLVRTIHSLARVPMAEAVKMASATPARHLNIFDKKGSIAVGKDADLLLFDNDVRIRRVLVRGETVEDAS